MRRKRRARRDGVGMRWSASEAITASHGGSGSLETRGGPSGGGRARARRGEHPFVLVDADDAGRGLTERQRSASAPVPMPRSRAANGGTIVASVPRRCRASRRSRNERADARRLAEIDAEMRRDAHQIAVRSRWRHARYDARPTRGRTWRRRDRRPRPRRTRRAGRHRRATRATLAASASRRAADAAAWRSGATAMLVRYSAVDPARSTSRRSPTASGCAASSSR